MKRLYALGLLCIVAACSHTAPHPTPTASPAPTASPTPAVTVPPTVGTSTPAVTASPTQSPSPAPPTPVPYNYIFTPAPAASTAASDPGAPHIFEIDMNERILNAPGPIRVRILTNAAVTSVIARTMGRELGVPQEAPGVFGADDEIPNIPFFLRNRTFSVEIVAAVADGRTTSVTLPITLR